MTTALLAPPALGKPLQVTDFAMSVDDRRMVFATSGRPTMIRKTAYDYWTLDKVSGDWRKLAGTADGGLLYAKLSPDGSRAAYVRANNLFVEERGEGTGDRGKGIGDREEGTGDREEGRDLGRPSPTHCARHLSASKRTFVCAVAGCPARTIQ